MAKGTELIEPTKGGLPAEYVDFGEEYSGAGMENTTAAELLKPFLTALHYQCPQIEVGGQDAIEGAQAGMLYNTATGQLSDGLKVGVEIVPVFRRHVYTEWLPDRGGFAGEHDPESEIVFAAQQRAIKEKLKFGELYTDDGNSLTNQFNIFFLYAPDGSQITAENAQEALTGFTSARIRQYQKWYGMAKNIRYPNRQGRLVEPALFAHSYRMKTLPDKNDQGNWFTYDIRLTDPTPNIIRPSNSLIRTRDPDLFDRAMAFYELLRDAQNSGTVVANYEKANEATASIDDEVPF